MGKYIAFLLGAIMLSSSVPALAQQASTPAPIAPLPVTSRFEDVVLVSATLNGHAEWFELDTAVQGLVLDPSTVQSLELTPAADGTVVADISVGTFHARQASFTVKSVDQSLTATHVAGQLGAPFFASGVVQIDFHHQAVTMTPASAFVAPTENETEAPLSILGHLPFVHAWFGDTRAAMLLDTSATITSLFDKFASRVTLSVPSGDNTNDQIMGRDNSVPETKVPYTAASVAIGGLRLRQVSLLLSHEQRIFDPGVYADGTLGLDILDNFVITLDYPESKVYFSY